MANPAQLIHGYALIGIFSNILLYGVMINQTFTYFHNFRHKDRLAMQIYVGILFLVDTLNSVFNVWWIYNVLINNFGNFEALTVGDWLLASDAAMTAIIAFMVQTFFAWRVKILTQNIWITAFVVLLAFGGFVTGLGSAIINQALYPKFEDFTKYSYMVTPWLAFCAACDVVLTVSLTWKLKQKSGFRAETDDILNKIIRLTVQNGALTSLCAVLDIIFFLTIPNGLHLTFNYTLAKLYSNSAMSSLNSRASMSLGINPRANDPSFPSSSSQTAPRSSNVRKPFDFRPRSGRTPNTTEVYVDVETHEMQDTEPIKPRQSEISLEEGRLDSRWDDSLKRPTLSN